MASFGSAAERLQDPERADKWVSPRPDDDLAPRRLTQQLNLIKRVAGQPLNQRLLPIGGAVTHAPAGTDDTRRHALEVDTDGANGRPA